MMRKKGWKEGIHGQKASKQASKGSSPVGEGRCAAGNGTTLGGWCGTAIGAREVVEGMRLEHRKIKS